jgi:hypothetical protein
MNLLFFYIKETGNFMNLRRYNIYNIGWIIILALSLGMTHEVFNHLGFYTPHIKTLFLPEFSWNAALNFNLNMIYPCIASGILSLMAFFILSPCKIKDDKTYLKYIHSLGRTLFANAIFSLIWFLTMPLNMDVISISTLVILMVFYAQHLRHKLINYLVQFLLVMNAILFMMTSEVHLVDLFLSIFWALSLVIMFNYSPNYEPSLHIKSAVREAPVYKRYVVGLSLYAIALFVLPVFNYFTGIHYHMNNWLYIIAWLGFVSLMTICKVMFFGNHFPVRQSNHQFLWHFYLVGGIYLKIRKWTIYLTNYYSKPIEVLPYLYISNTLVIARHELKDNERVINLAWEISHRQKNTHSYPLVDLVIPRPEQVYQIIADMNEMITKGNTVYVHCALGVFRTIFITGSYLTFYEKKEPQAVFDHIFSLLPDNHMKTYIKGKEPLYIKLWSEL